MFKWFWTVFSLGAFSLDVPDTFEPIFMFCEKLENELLPNKRVELNFKIEFYGKYPILATSTSVNNCYILLLYIRLTMKNLIGREHSINSQ